MKRGILLLALLGVLGTSIALGFHLLDDRDGLPEEDSKDDELISMIADEFKKNKETLYTIANTLPENHRIRGGETPENPRFVKDYESDQKFYGKEIMDINPALYMAVCKLEKSNFQVYGIASYCDRIEFTTEIKSFTSYLILYVKNNATLEDILTIYDGYTMLEESEWYIAWRTRGGV